MGRGWVAGVCTWRRGLKSVSEQLFNSAPEVDRAAVATESSSSDCPEGPPHRFWGDGRVRLYYRERFVASLAFERACWRVRMASFARFFSCVELIAPPSRSSSFAAFSKRSMQSSIFVWISASS